jgi:hypothetical protein
MAAGADKKKDKRKKKGKDEANCLPAAGRRISALFFYFFPPIKRIGFAVSAI